MTNETWKPIPNVEYAVSNTGKVASMKHGWKILKTRDDHHGYPSLTLRKPGIRKEPRVYNLVADAFLPPKPSPEHEVNHKDGDKQNSHIDNLEWMTGSQNQIHRREVLGKHRTGQEKVDEEQVKQILALKNSGLIQREVGKKFGVSASIVGYIWRRETWKWVQDV